MDHYSRGKWNQQVISDQETLIKLDQNWLTGQAFQANIADQ